ncbi:hypothetical protein [Aquamicrobium zhengzhouense]|nr:hypothetical protein [Aquamicrobium zhengzhouense]
MSDLAITLLAVTSVLVVVIVAGAFSLRSIISTVSEFDGIGRR